MLESSQVNRSLERKTLILWLELIDIFIIVTTASLLNLVFGQTGLKLYLVYLPTILLSITMIMTKRGKPDQFLLHFMRYHLKSKHQSCFDKGTDIYVYSQAAYKKRGLL